MRARQRRHTPVALRRRRRRVRVPEEVVRLDAARFALLKQRIGLRSEAARAQPRRGVTQALVKNERSPRARRVAAPLHRHSTKRHARVHAYRALRLRLARALRLLLAPARTNKQLRGRVCTPSAAPHAARRMARRTHGSALEPPGQNASTHAAVAPRRRSRRCAGGSALAASARLLRGAAQPQLLRVPHAASRFAAAVTAAMCGTVTRANARRRA